MSAKKIAIRRPMLGIWWLVDGEVIEFAVDAAQVPLAMGFKDANIVHAFKWTQMQKLFPQLKNKEYDEIPRGRVVGIGSNRYRILIPPELAKDARLISQVMKVFNLPTNMTELMPDEHYVTETEGSAFSTYWDADDDEDIFEDEDAEYPTHSRY